MDDEYLKSFGCTNPFLTADLNSTCQLGNFDSESVEKFEGAFEGTLFVFHASFIKAIEAIKAI